MPGEKLLIVSSSPHIKTDEDTRSIMLDVIIALLPALAMAVYLFGWRSLSLVLVSVASCVAFEFLYRKIMKKPASVGDLSAVVTGILIAYNVPVSVPYWLMIIAAFFAIVVVKQLFGGIGMNFLNPALAARVFMFSWTGLMTNWPVQMSRVPVLGAAVDAVTAATPLAYMKRGEIPAFDLFEMFTGQHGGSLGEVSAAMLLLGGLYLLIRRVINPRIPVAFIGTVAILAFIFPKGDQGAFTWSLYSVLSGGVMLGAVFMATDYATSPITKRGQWIFGIGCGLITIFIRYFSTTYPEGVSFSILVMNSCVWLIDKYSKPRRFGGGGLYKRKRRASGGGTE